MQKALFANKAIRRMIRPLACVGGDESGRAIVEQAIMERLAHRCTDEEIRGAFLTLYYKREYGATPEEREQIRPFIETTEELPHERKQEH